MNLTLLGTGSADGWPNPHCRCASCTAARSAGSLRGQTAALLDGTLLLDCGPEAPHAAQRAGLDLTGLRHVLLTHAHPDHCAPAFLLFRSWVGSAPLDVVGPPEVVEQARLWVAPDSHVRFVTVSAGDRLTLDAYDVRVLAAQHGDEGACVLYDVTGPGGRVLYATDTGPLPPTTVEAVRGAAFDVVLLEETFGDHASHGTDHLDLRTFPEQLRRLRMVGAVTDDTDVVAVHLSHHNPPTPELSRRLAAETEVVYVATAYPADHDEEWSERVRLHRQRRPGHWSTLETTDLVPLLQADGPPLLVDCLTLWLTRVMDRHDAWDDATWATTGEPAVHDEVDRLVRAWRATGRRVVAVTNEVGQGVVPETSAGRRFRDLMGHVNARVAAETEDVSWCVAGRVTRL